MKLFCLLIFLPILLLAETIQFFINSEKTTTFTIPIPNAFQEAWRAPNGKMVEYLPQNESADAWTEIITIEAIPRQAGMLDFYLRKHKIAIELLFSRAESELALRPGSGKSPPAAPGRSFRSRATEAWLLPPNITAGVVANALWQSVWQSSAFRYGWCRFSPLESVSRASFASRPSFISRRSLVQVQPPLPPPPPEGLCELLA